MIKLKSAALSKSEIQSISLDRFKKNEWNCNVMIKEEFESLKTSMKIEGQISPVLVITRDNYFLIIDGDKRLVAAMELGWKSLQAIVEEGVTDDQVKVKCFITHYNKGFLDPIKTFNLFYEEWIRESGKSACDDNDEKENVGDSKVTTRQLEQKYGIDQTWISRILTIRKIPEPIRNYISSLMPLASKRFSIKHAIVLAEKAQTIPEKDLKDIVDYFFSPQNKKVESYTDLKLLLETIGQKASNETSETDTSARYIFEDFDDSLDRQDKIRKIGNARNEEDDNESTRSKPKFRSAFSGNFSCEGCNNNYLIDWNNKRVLRLNQEDTFVKASEIQITPAKVIDGCPSCGKQISIDFDERTFKWN